VHARAGYRTGLKTGEGSLYAALHRLEMRGGSSPT
jgi:hypothetical protein